MNKPMFSKYDLDIIEGCVIATCLHNEEYAVTGRDASTRTACKVAARRQRFFLNRHFDHPLPPGF